MKARHILIATLAVSSGLAAPQAHAQDDDYASLDEDGAKKKKKRKQRKSAVRDEVVREIVKGTYAKANVGGAGYLLDFASFVNWGTSLGLAVGQDFVDQASHSMAWELSLYQGIHNGTHYQTQGDLGCKGVGGAAPCVEGDLRTYTFLASLEYSIYPQRRVGIGGRLGGGVLYSPLLMEPTYYQDEVVSGTWGGYDPGYHNAAHPAVLVGPTFEYYTKLPHFSVGVDADVIYAIGWDLGTSITGALKYTF